MTLRLRLRLKVRLRLILRLYLYTYHHLITLLLVIISLLHMVYMAITFQSQARRPVKKKLAYPCPYFYSLAQD